MSKDQQVAALPIRRASDGSLEILLVTSRETQRWVLPKGWPWRKHSKHDSAAGEALEEAGILGRISTTPIGTYRYPKRGETGDRTIGVTVFTLEVTTLLDSWPEAHQRTRAWFTPQAAADAVIEPELKLLLASLALAVIGAGSNAA